MSTGREVKLRGATANAPFIAAVMDMRAPVFTAELSLYKSRGRYRAMAGPPNTSIDGQRAVPQAMALMKCLEGCHAFNVADPAACQDECFWGDFAGGGSGGSGGGGGGQSCTPSCSLCQRDPNSPTGGTRICLRSDCRTVESTCWAGPWNRWSMPSMNSVWTVGS